MILVMTGCVLILSYVGMMMLVLEYCDKETGCCHEEIVCDSSNVALMMEVKRKPVVGTRKLTKMIILSMNVTLHRMYK